MKAQLHQIERNGDELLEVPDAGSGVEPCLRGPRGTLIRRNLY